VGCSVYVPKLDTPLSAPEKQPDKGLPARDPKMPADRSQGLLKVRGVLAAQLGHLLGRVSKVDLE